MYLKEMEELGLDLDIYYMCEVNMTRKSNKESKYSSTTDRMGNQPRPSTKLNHSQRLAVKKQQ